MSTKTKHVIIQHVFKNITKPGEESFEITVPALRAHGHSVEYAKKHQVFGAEKWEYVRTNRLPYTHADISEAIAAALGEQWEAVPQSEEYPDCGWRFIRAGDGLTLCSSPPSYSHRNAWRFSVSAPRHKGAYVEAYDGDRSRMACPGIGCADTKTPEQMAKDITRRLLPDAEKYWNAVVEQIRNMEEGENQQADSIRAVCAAMNKPAANDYQTKQPSAGQSFDGGTFEVHHGGNVAFKLYSMEIGKAVKLAAAIKAIL